MLQRIASFYCTAGKGPTGEESARQRAEDMLSAKRARWLDMLPKSDEARKQTAEDRRRQNARPVTCLTLLLSLADGPPQASSTCSSQLSP